MERGIPELGRLVNGIVAFVYGEGQRLEIGDVERRLIPMVMELGRSALEEFVVVKRTGHAGKETAHARSSGCPYVRGRKSAYRSIFGTIPIMRVRPLCWHEHVLGVPVLVPEFQ